MNILLYRIFKNPLFTNTSFNMLNQAEADIKLIYKFNTNMEFILLFIFFIFPYSVYGQDTGGASQTSYENKLNYIDETLLNLKVRLATLANENAVLRESVEIADGKRDVYEIKYAH